MAQLTKAMKRDYGVNSDPVGNDLPMDAGVTIYEGAAVGLTGSGLARQLASGDSFGGFAMRTVVNSGAAGAAMIRTQDRGTVTLDVLNGIADNIGDVVYASDSNTFSVTDSGSDAAIGNVRRFVGNGVSVVAFEALSLQ